MSTPLPPMSRQEASWHEHLAGMRAAEEARKAGADPLAIDAIASATAGPVKIGKFTLHPASQGTVWTLKKVAKQFAAYAEQHNIPSSGDPQDPADREIIEMGLAALAFADARGTWMALNPRDFPGLVLKADELMWETSAEIQLALQAHFTSEMDRLAALNPDGPQPMVQPKKLMPLATEPGSSRELPTQLADTDSQQSNGCAQNTESPSPEPSGGPRC